MRCRPCLRPLPSTSYILVPAPFSIPNSSDSCGSFHPSPFLLPWGQAEAALEAGKARAKAATPPKALAPASPGPGQASGSPAPSFALPPHLEEYTGDSDNRKALMAWKKERQDALVKLQRKQEEWAKVRGAGGGGRRKGGGGRERGRMQRQSKRGSSAADGLAGEWGGTRGQGVLGEWEDGGAGRERKEDRWEAPNFITASLNFDSFASLAAGAGQCVAPNPSPLIDICDRHSSRSEWWCETSCATL